MNYELIRELIEQNRARITFAQYGEGTPDEWIENAQFRLGVRFPPSYVWWLKSYRGGGIDGEEISSVYNPGYAHIPGGDIVYMNELEQKDGIFSSHQLVIQHNDFGEDYFLALDEPDVSGECPVYVAPYYEKYADSFIHFLEKKLNY